MQLFENTKSDISDILKGNKKRNNIRSFSGRTVFADSFQKSMTANFDGSLFNIPDVNIHEYSDPKILINVDPNQLANLFGTNNWSFPMLSIGTHPDFEHLTYNQYCYHYCVSMFLDIKGSTRLATKYSL